MASIVCIHVSVPYGLLFNNRKYRKYKCGQGGQKPGILRDFSEHEKLWEYCATSGKNYF